jgi:glycerol-3-phosphate O-acyltransferase 3/4
LNTSEILRDAADALIDDSFFRCFTSAPPDPWNWNWYLFPAWLLGVILRYFLLFPVRLLLLFVSQTVFFALFFPVQFVLKVRGAARFVCG